MYNLELDGSGYCNIVIQRSQTLL